MLCVSGLNHTHNNHNPTPKSNPQHGVLELGSTLGLNMLPNRLSLRFSLVKLGPWPRALFSLSPKDLTVPDPFISP